MTDSTTPAASHSVEPDAGGRAGSESQPPTISAEALSTRGRMGRVLGVRILATGSYVPERIVTNEDLAALGCDSEWIVRRTGILQRRHAAIDQATSDLAYAAAVNCLAASGKTSADLDLIVVCTMTPDHPTPSTACHLQRRLGATAPAMDVNAACAGFMYGMITAAQFIAAGNSNCALVVGADLMSRTVNPDDKKTYPLFGDAAGAAILTGDPSDPGGAIPAYQLGSEGCGGEMLCVPAGGSRTALSPDMYAAGEQYLRMDGRGVFKWAVRVFHESAKQVLEQAGVAADELALVILHQANQRIIDSAVADLDVPAEKVYVNLDRFGNTSAASIPVALDEAARAGKIQRGDLVLMCGFGAGLAWGTAVVRW